MKKSNLIKKILSAIVLSCLLLSASAVSISAANTITVINQSDGASIDAEKGVLLCYTDLNTKTLVMTGFASDLISSVTLTVEDEAWINASPYGGYIHMKGTAGTPTRTVVTFNGGDGVTLGVGRFTTTYKAAVVKGSTAATCTDIFEKITYNENLSATYNHKDDCARLIAVADGWADVLATFESPSDMTKLISYEIGLNSANDQYYDNIEIWFYPENAFITDKNGTLSMTLVDSDSYTFPTTSGIAGWVCDGKIYRAGDTVNIDELSQKTLTALESINMIDTEKITFEYKYENDRAGSADGTMTVSFGSQIRRNIKLVELLWGYGNESDGYAPLADYTPLKSAVGTDFPLTYTLDKDLAIPPEANALLLAVTDDVTTHYIASPIPEHKKHPDKEPLYTVAFISDIHVGWSGLSLRPSQIAAQKEINKFGVDYTVVVGDFVQWYGEHAMAKEWTIAAKYFRDFEMPVYFTKGNHDEPNYKTAYIINKGLENYDTLFSYEYFDEWLDNWLKYSKQKGYYDVERVGSELDYYATEIAGHQYVFLAIPNEGYYKIDEEQLKWVEKVLFEAEESGKPIFVMGHVPLEHKVAHKSDKWKGGYENDELLEEIFALHPNVIYISGDTHYTIDSETQNTVNGAQLTPSYFNDGAVVDDVWKAADESDPTSNWSKQPGDLTQGIIAEVYDDRILLRGRYFITEQWISQGLSELTFRETCPIEKFEVEKQTTADGELLLTVNHKNTDGLTYSWYLDGELQSEHGASLTLSPDYAGYIAVRATDENGNYRSELYDSLAEIKDFEVETETTEITTQETTEVTTETPTETATGAPLDQTTEESDEKPTEAESKTETESNAETDDKNGAETNANTSGGCNSSLSTASSVIAATAAGVAIALKKKKRDEK